MFFVNTEEAHSDEGVPEKLAPSLVRVLNVLISHVSVRASHSVGVSGPVRGNVERVDRKRRVVRSVAFSVRNDERPEDVGHLLVQIEAVSAGLGASKASVRAH